PYPSPLSLHDALPISSCRTYPPDGRLRRHPLLSSGPVSLEDIWRVPSVTPACRSACAARAVLRKCRFPAAWLCGFRHLRASRKRSEEHTSELQSRENL